MKEKQKNGNDTKQTNREKSPKTKKTHMCMQRDTFTITQQNKAEQQVCNGL